MRILALSLAYAAGLLTATLVLAIDALLLRGLWLPVATAAAIVLLLVYGLPRKRCLPWYALSVVFGVAGFWALALPPEVVSRVPALGFAFAVVFPVAGTAFLLVATLRRRPGDGYLALTILAAFAVAYFSGNTGKPGPMLQWLRDLGLTAAQADILTLAIRKTVHFAGYGTVSLFAFLGALRAGTLYPTAIRFALGYALVLACFDELRQLGAFHRSGTPFDVLLDLAGILFFLLVAARKISYTSRP